MDGRSPNDRSNSSHDAENSINANSISGSDTQFSKDDYLFPREETMEPGSARSQEPIGFYISNKKFWIMMICTLGTYVLVWAYRNFRALKVPGDGKLGSGVYAFFFRLSYFSLMKTIEERARERGISVNMNKWPFAIFYFFLGGIGTILARNGGDIGALAALFMLGTATIFIFVTQYRLADLNKQLNAQPETGFKGTDFLIIVIGLVFAFTLG